MQNYKTGRVRKVITALDGGIGKTPFFKPYAHAVSWLSRNLAPPALQKRIGNSFSAEDSPWRRLSFESRPVTACGVEFNLHPHIGEFDQESAFSKAISYEPEMFAWLKEKVPGRYDQVIEVGSNVGVFTCFLGALKRQLSLDLHIHAFEPSAEAYWRLLGNLRANGFHDVRAFNLAVAEEAGFRDFFEPQGHLTNGSFLKSFAGIFSDAPTHTTVACIGPDQIKQLLSRSPVGKTLFKVDVEGFEAQLLTSLGPLITEYKADVIFEVLGVDLAKLSTVEIVQNSKLFQITESGEQPHSALFASDNRDWLLRPC